MKEKRRHPRVITHLSVSFAAYDIEGLRTGILSNLSIQGAGVISDTIIKAGEEVSVYIHGPGEAEPITIDLARVQWATHPKFGLEFLISKKVEKDRLKRLRLKLIHSTFTSQ